MIVDVFCAGPIETNAYLLGCSATRRAVVIDAPYHSAEPILRRSQELSLTIEKILLTHSHWDHTAGLAELKARTQALVLVHKEDASNVAVPGSDHLPLFIEVEGVMPDGYLEDGQLLQVGKLTLEVIHTPGHTPGGVCFYLREAKVLFSGDTLFQGTIGRLDLPTARKSLMWSSLSRLAALPKETRVFPGHGEETTIGKEQWIIQAEERYE
jgi:glyoxylase-like metal-dependent hydrolase (beta-lactamase superfamily II)